MQLTGQLGNQAGYMASPKIIAEDKPRAAPDGTGPFVVDSWEPDKRITAHRNPNYWQHDLPYLDAIEFRFVPDFDTRLEQLRRGDVDAIVGESSKKSDLDPKEGRILTSQIDKRETIVVLNTAKPPLDDHRVREALAHATDISALLREVGSDSAAADSPFSKESSFYAKTPYPGFDRAQATKLLDEYRAEHGPVHIELTGWSSPEIIRAQQLLADQWKEFGVDVTLKTEDQRRVPLTIAAGDYQASLFQKFDGLDPDSYGMFVDSANVNGPELPSLNLARIRDPEIDRAIDLGRSTTDMATRREAYTSLQRQLNADLGFLWLYYAPTTVLVAPRVKAVGDDVFPDGTKALPFQSGRHQFARLWLEDPSKTNADDG